MIAKYETIVSILNNIHPLNEITIDIDENITGNKIGFDYIDMVYLFLKLEETFKVKFQPDDIYQYKLNTIRGILDVLNKKV